MKREAVRCLLLGFECFHSEKRCLDLRRERSDDKNFPSSEPDLMLLLFLLLWYGRSNMADVSILYF